jgi:hypothetical protein
MDYGRKAKCGSRVWRCQREVKSDKLTGVERAWQTELSRTDHSEPKVHGVHNCGVLTASQYCFGTLRGPGER